MPDQCQTASYAPETDRRTDGRTDRETSNSRNASYHDAPITNFYLLTRSCVISASAFITSSLMYALNTVIMIPLTSNKADMTVECVCMCAAAVSSSVWCREIPFITYTKWYFHGSKIYRAYSIQRLLPWDRRLSADGITAVYNQLPWSTQPFIPQG